MDHFMEIFLLCVTVLIVSYYIYEKAIAKKTKRYQEKLAIPGLNKTHPTLGNLEEFREYGSLHQFLCHLHNKYGNVASFYWKHTFVVSICDHESFRYVKHLFDRAGIAFDFVKSFIGEECIQFANGVEGRDRRKCYDRSFNQKALFRYIKTMEDVANEEIKNIDSSGTLVLPSIAETGLTMAIKVILRCCIAPNKAEDAFIVKILHLYEVVMDGLIDRLINEKVLDPSDPSEIAFQAQKEEFQSSIREIVIARMKILDQEEGRKDGQMLLDDIIYFHGDVNLEVIIKDVLVYMVAGFHTTGHLFSWCILRLAENPDYQDKIFAEILKNQFNYKTSEEYIEVIRNMPFLRAFINETLRFDEIGSFGSRFSNEDMFIGPYFVPANTPIILAFGVSLQDRNIFKNPDKFDPSRFMGEGLPSLAFVPFGFAGKRKCPAEQFSYLEISISLIQFIKKYKFKLMKPHEKVKKVYGIVTHMERPLSVILEPR